MALKQLFEVARRDFLQRAKSRAFLVTTLLTVGVVLTIAPLIAIETQEPPPSVVGIAGEEIPGFSELLPVAAEGSDIEVEVLRGATEDDVVSGEVDVLVVDGDTVVWAERRSAVLGSVVNTALRGATQAQAVNEVGLSPEEAGPIMAPPPPEEEILDPPAEDAFARVVAAQAGTFVLYMTIIIFGQFILMGVMEEKQSRVVEVVLARIPPDRLLAGKILGVGFLGLVQLLLLGGAIAFAASLFDIGDIDLSALSLSTLATITVWFLLGYAFYAVIYGALGATVSRQEDAQGAVMLPTLLVVPGFGISLFSLDSPDSVVAVIASYVPITSPMVMPVRMALGDVAWWEPVLSALIIIASVYLLVKLGGRVYRGAVLNIGAKVRLRDAWKAAAS